MAVRFNQQIYLFEFKVVELTPEGQALQQIKDKGYADKYRAEGLPIHLIGGNAPVFPHRFWKLPPLM
jgi:hypothetical protein